jgi:hypothetical protein
MAAVAAQRAGEPDRAASAGTPAPDLKVNVAGMQVAIDPKTGRLRPPTAEESRALAEALRQQFAAPTRPLEVIRAANGALAMELPEDYMETAIIRIAPDGTRSIECVSPAEAERIISEEASNLESAPGFTPAPPSAAKSPSTGPTAEAE